MAINNLKHGVQTLKTIYHKMWGVELLRRQIIGRNVARPHDMLPFNSVCLHSHGVQPKIFESDLGFWRI